MEQDARSGKKNPALPEACEQFYMGIEEDARNIERFKGVCLSYISGMDKKEQKKLDRSSPGQTYDISNTVALIGHDITDTYSGPCEKTVFVKLL